MENKQYSDKEFHQLMVSHYKDTGENTCSAGEIQAFTSTLLDDSYYWRLGGISRFKTYIRKRLYEKFQDPMNPPLFKVADATNNMRNGSIGMDF